MHYANSSIPREFHLFFLGRFLKPIITGLDKDRLRKAYHIIVGIGVAEGFADRMVKILAINERNGAFKKITPSEAIRRIGQGAILLSIIGKIKTLSSNLVSPSCPSLS